jgi:signal transduction histidine kinase
VLGDLESTASAAARARMTFLMTGAASELSQYRDTVSQLPEKTRYLRALVRDNPLQVSNCERLQTLLDARIKEWNASIEAKLNGRAPDLDDLLEKSLRLSAESGAIGNAIRLEEFQLLQERTQDAHERFLIAIATVIISFVLAILLLYLHYRLLNNELNARERAEHSSRLALESESALRRDLELANANLLAEAKQRALVQQRLSTSEKSLRELSLHLLKTQDEERRRIGRELHDSLGQYLAILKMNLDTLNTHIAEANSTAREHLGQCVQLVQDSIKEMRTISYLLYPPMLEEVGLQSAIGWYLEGFSQRSNIQISFQSDPEFGRLERDIELALFRVLQECLTNVHRHSGSSIAEIRLTKKDDMAVLEVADKGKGIPQQLLERSNGDWLGSLGVGLRGMNERIRQLGGKLEIYSTETGTVVTAGVPVAQTVSPVGSLR